MSDATPVTPAERTPGAATSAVTRDAARLRSVMSDLRREGPVMPAEPAPAQFVPTPAYLETVMPAPRSNQATELRNPASAPRPASAPAMGESAANERNRATRLRSVASLVEMRLADEQRKGAVATVPMPEPPPVAKAEPRRATESAVRHLEIPIYEPEPAGPTYSSDGESRFRVVMVLAGTVIAGLVIGVGLYAGGGELVSNLFGSEPVAPVDPNPAAITERPIVEIAPVAPIDSMATASIPATAADQPHMTMTERTASIADAPRTEPPTVMENTLPPTASDRPRIDKPAADVVTGSPRTESAPRTEPRPEPRRSTSRADETAAERPTPARAAPKSFTVQVRATPDQAEAKLIAKKLRSKGAKDVEVVRSEKNGVAFYRIRYRSQGTASEAQAVAGRAGYSDTWIVRD